MGEADPVLLVLPADHVIRDVESFREAVVAGRAAAELGKLVTFGVVPDRPETGYGYIRRARGEGPVYPVAEFVEKPDLATAVRYVQSGEYFWNSGMFMFRARTYLAELREHAPAMLAACEAAVAAATRDLDFTRLPPAEFGACPADSVDYAVMEKTTAAVVVPLDAGWSDVGSWSALQDALQHGRAGQRHGGRRDHRGRHRLLPALDEPADRRRRPHGPRRGRDQGRGAGRAARQGPGREGAGRPAEGPGPLRDLAAPRGVPPVGQLRQHRRRRAIPGQAAGGEARRLDVAAAAPPPRRALDRGLGHRAHHARRGDLPARRERVDFHPDGHEAPHRESGHGHAAHHRGAVGQLPRRGRHRAIRGRYGREGSST